MPKSKGGLDFAFGNSSKGGSPRVIEVEDEDSNNFGHLDKRSSNRGSMKASINIEVGGFDSNTSKNEGKQRPSLRRPL